jgi:TolB-like protein/tetratricopeptide (TPR) repeat protein/class 3 adenylate cyclase
MADEQKTKLRLEIAHVLFMDIVGYSKLLTDEQSEALQELNQIVRSTEAAREAEAAGALTVLPTGDGMALVFTRSVEEPVECALEISQALRAQPSLPVRMGIHSGPIHHVKDANGRENIAGIGINIAQRVMDCGDAGHILVSKRVADDLAQQRRWQLYIHELGDVEVKHGVVVSLVNLYAETIGNPTPPTRLGKARGSIPGSRVGTRKALSPPARAIFIFAILLLVLAIVSAILAPAIMRTLDQRRLATLPQPTATALPSLADTIKSAVAKQITDELQGELSRKKNAAVQPAPTGSAIPEKSIAVLPFDNLSRDPDNAYFCEGVQDEILTRLAKVADLKVISRTSTQHFKSTPDNLPQIAKQLGVAHILEGSVQKAADQVRVNVQLINALTDAHLWADTYDRKLTDIFAVESEIAKTVADVLQAKLTGSEQHVIAARPTANTEAHQLYLKGRFFWNKRTGNDLKKSIDYFQQAIAADPNYALAYAGVADAYVLIPGYSGANPRDCYPKAIAAAKKALELDDTLAEARTSLALAIWYYDFDFSQANREFQRAIELNPNYAIAHQQYGNNTLSAIGRFNDAIAEGKRAVELDPLSLVINADLSVDYYYARRYDEAIAQLRKLLEMDPGYYFAYVTLGEALEMKGARDAAIAEYQKARALNDDPLVLALLAHAYGLSGNKMEAEKILDQLKALSQARYVSAYSFALAYLGLGSKEEALRWLEQSYQDRAGADVGWIRVDPLLDPLNGDPRFEALAEKIIPAAEFKSAISPK